jgi:uncharacterized protein YjbI with pentapeptide repeats
MARKTRPPKRHPDPPSLPAHRQPAPTHLESGDEWDGVLAGAGVEVPEHVPDLSLRECRWNGADLSGRQLRGLRCRDTEFVRCDLSGAVLDDAMLTRVTFTDCRLTGTVLAGAELKDVRISASRADLVTFRMARASFLLVEDTVLRAADFYEFTGTDCAFLACDLTGVNVDKATLAGTDLHGSTLEDVTGAFALRGCRISPEQVVTLGAVLLDALDVRVTDRD